MQYKVEEKNNRYGYVPIDSYNILYTKQEKDYDELTNLASVICEVPWAALSIIDGDKIWHKATYHLSHKTLIWEDTFYEYVLNSQENIISLNAENYPDFFSKLLNPKGQTFKFFACVPLYNKKRQVFAFFSIFDEVSRKLTKPQENSLIALANQAQNLLEFRKQKNKLENVQQSLKYRYKELEKFTSIVSHDIKSPLANIISLTELLKEENKDKFDKETSMYFNFLVESSYSLRDYVDGILNFYRSDHLYKENLEDIDLRKLLKGISKLYAVYEDVEITYPKNVVLKHINKAALSQVFMNLISNALKYNDNKLRKVIISFEESNTNYTFKVKDNGRGIDKKDISKIFKIFTTLDETDREGNTGTGIGLATVKKIIKNMQGSIYVTSELNVGSTFEFTIPKNNQVESI